MPNCKHFNFDDLVRLEHQIGLEAKVATQHLMLYHLAQTMSAPTLVEFGVALGRSTCVLLQAAEETNGHLYSFDVVDCSNVAVSNAWTFTQESDQNVENILNRIPAMASGIDLLHIDSLHSRDHVLRLLLKWYPHIKPGGYITFHDVDPTPYLHGQRKDSPKHEPEAIGVAKVIQEFFYANEDVLYLSYHFGSTGMGIMRKLAPLHVKANPPKRIRTREIKISPGGVFWSLRYRLSRLFRSGGRP
jgi:predicted O-methyltransferase YrrM